MEEKVLIDVGWIVEETGMTISDLNRFSGVSRNTLYSLKRGQTVRRSTARRLLESIYYRNRCEPIRTRVLELLVDLESEVRGERTVAELISDLDEIIHEIATIESRLSNREFEELSDLKDELVREVKRLGRSEV